MSKRSLGKGLGSILGEVAQAYEKELPQNTEILEIDIDDIRKNPFQPRRHFDEASLKELAESIKTHGLLQPVVVIEDIDGFMLIAGERRLRASKLVGLSKIKAIVADIDKSRYREIALIENIQRENLSALELALSYKELIEEYGITHEELADIVKKSRTHITNTLRLLQLSEYAKEALQQGKISTGHAKVLVGLPLEEQKVLVDSIVGQRLSVRETEKLASQKKSPQKRAKEQKRVMIQPLKKKIEEKGFVCKTNGNRLIIEFENDEEVKQFEKLFE